MFPQEELKLWYDRPASQWVEALPVGNGYIGAMIFGGVENELIQLNEGSLWSGGPRKDNVNPEAYSYLKPLREALAREDYQKADELCRKMQGYFSESFLPMGDLHIRQHFKDGANYSNYRRDLNLEKAVVTVSFGCRGVNYTREIFTSAPDSVMIIRITADKSGMISLDLSLTSRLQHTVSVNNNRIEMSGKAPARVDPSYYNKQGREPVAQEDTEGCNGMRFQSLLQVIPEGGTITADGEGIQIKDADAVTIYLSAATSFNGFDKCPDSDGKDEKYISKTRLENALLKTFDELKMRHTEDFGNYFNRVSLSLPNKQINGEVNRLLPSDFRLKLYSFGNYDPELEALFFQYGRYLLISSSRPGGTAANLQGIWNKEFRAPWSSNYTININTQMNYWPAGPGNLEEMQLPLIELVKNLSQTGKKTAKEYYKARGWVAHHNTDIWALSNAVGNKGDGGPVWANWYMGGNWLSQHLWEHYAFTGDKDFLKNTAYPIMKEAALFCFDWLVEKGGYLITSPSTSPENIFITDDNKRSAISEGVTMDIAIIRDLFDNIIEASQELNIDKAFRKQVTEKRNKLYPYQIGSKGQLQEWTKDFREADPQHRHLSHLFGLHPGRQISPLTTPELAQACERTFEIRGDEGTGWSKGWKINFAARLLDGNHAYKMIREIMRYVDPSAGTSYGGTYPNFFDAHPPFQIDGNFGASAGIIEMLLQSHLKEIHLLPALPHAWTEGQVTGLKARGNFEVGISWNENRLEKATIKSNLGNKCVLRTSVPVRINGVQAEKIRQGKYYISTFETSKGKIYSIEIQK